MFKNFTIASLAMAFAASAFAGPVTTPGNSNGITWDEFKNRCVTMGEGYPNQREPRQIKIQCTNVERDFVPDAPGSVDLAANRTVITALFSDKFHVSPSQKEFPIHQKPGSCLRYKEIEKTITIEKALSCADVAGIKGDVNDYCASSLELAKGSNPKLIDVRDTGRTLGNCEAYAAPIKK